LLSWAFRPTSLRHCCCSSCLKYSILLYHARNYLDWFLAHDTGYLGTTDRLSHAYRLFMSFGSRFEPDTGLLHPSKTMFMQSPSRLTIFTLRTMSALGLTELTVHPTTGRIFESTNLTILNFLLLRFGPMNEKRLVQVLIAVQVRVHCLKRRIVHLRLIGCRQSSGVYCEIWTRRPDVRWRPQIKKTHVL